MLLGSSLELLAVATPVAAVALVTGYVTAAAPRRRILSLAGWLGAAGVPVGLLALPFAWLTLVHRRPPLPYPPASFATDLENIVVPTTTVVGGTLAESLEISATFVGNIGEQGAYLGVPLLAVCLITVLGDRRSGVLVAGMAFFVSLLWSLGPAITVAGQMLSAEPLSLDHLPVLALALPARMSFLVSLSAAVLAAVWLSRPRIRWLRFAVGAVIVGSLWPHTGQLVLPQALVVVDRTQGLPLFGWQTTAVPPAPAAVTRPLQSGQSLLVLPFAWRRPTAYWQAAGGMRFRTAGGYTPFLPLEAVGDPTIASLLAAAPGPLAVERLRVFLRRAHVGRVVMLPGTGRQWRRTVGDALRPGLPAGRSVDASISPAGADAQSPVEAAAGRRVAVAWSQWDTGCACGRIAFSFPAGRASPSLESSRGFEAYGPAIAVSPDGRLAASAWIEARAGDVRIGLVRAGRSVQRLRSVVSANRSSFPSGSTTKIA